MPFARTILFIVYPLLGHLMTLSCLIGYYPDDFYWAKLTLFLFDLSTCPDEIVAVVEFLGQPDPDSIWTSLKSSTARRRSELDILRSTFSLLFLCPERNVSFYVNVCVIINAFLSLIPGQGKAVFKLTFAKIVRDLWQIDRIKIERDPILPMYGNVCPRETKLFFRFLSLTISLQNFFCH
mgnify:CR=1 FL=1